MARGVIDTSVASAVRDALEFVADLCDPSEVRYALADLSTARCLIDAAELKLVGLLHAAGAGDVDVAAELVGHAGRGAREASRVDDRAKLCADMPDVLAALDGGAIAAGHVDALVSGVRKLDAAQRSVMDAMSESLMAEAAEMSVDQFGEHVRDIVRQLRAVDPSDRLKSQRRRSELKTWIDDEGMIRLRGRFDAERGSILMGRLQSQVEAMFHSGAVAEVDPGIEPNDNLRATALFDLLAAGVEALRGGGRVAPARAEVVVMIDWDTLRTGVHQHSTCRTSAGAELPVDAVRRMACDAGIVPMVMNGDGEVLDVGRSKRLATAVQRKAIFAMYTSCAIPECRVNIEHCVPHHIDWWEHGGPTDMNNLIPLCSRHHHAVHEGGWKLEMRAGRKLCVTRPFECSTSGRRC